MSFEEAKHTFLLESRELLEEMEGALLQIEQQPDDAELINAIFRAAHTIKGSSGVFGFDAVGAFTHVVENVLDRSRDGSLKIGGDLVALLLRCRDHMAELVERAVNDEALSDALNHSDRQLREQLSRYLAGASATPATQGDDKPCWHISLRFERDTLSHGLDPLSLLNYLSGLGQLVGVRTLSDSLPTLTEIDPEHCYLGLEIALLSDETQQHIEDAFEFFSEDAQIHIIAPGAPLEAYGELLERREDEAPRLGELLVTDGVLSQHELDRLLERQGAIDADGAAHQRLGELVVDQGLATPNEVEKSLSNQHPARQNKTRNSIRVDADKLDHLINLVGELVIAGATTSLLAQRRGDEALQESNATMGRLVEEIRDSALKLRMVQIAETFTRFSRVVRDVSQEIGKAIKLEISGGETELDKTVVERIGDPLMHLVRNAMDHGIEASETRVAAGKPSHGTVSLNAFHDSGSIVIQVRDDGKGLDHERILAKAIERELVSPNQQLSRQEIARLIFEPGFSTAEQITSLSGRGVGMDVVKKNIEALRGTVDVDSTPGTGTTFTIRLPLTLAIIDGFLVKVGDNAYVVPLDMVLECVEMNEIDQPHNPDARYINLRGELLPFLQLREVFGEGHSRGTRENIVVVHYAGSKAGLVVDELLGEFQTVIKPLGKIFARMSGVSGATILGSGEVAIILDIPQLIHTASAGAGHLAHTTAQAAA